LTQKNSRQQDN